MHENNKLDDVKKFVNIVHLVDLEKLVSIVTLILHRASTTTTFMVGDRKLLDLAYFEKTKKRCIPW